MKEDTSCNYTTVNREGDVIAYNVPVVRFVWKNDKKEFAGLKDKIQSARSAAEVSALLEKGMSTYKDASSGTIAKWKRIANNRIREIESQKNNS